MAPVPNRMETAPAPDRARGAPATGPSRAFCRVRIVDSTPLVSGVEQWSGGTPVTGNDAVEGVFAGWSHDRGTVRVTIDRYGFFPLYYSATPTQFCISPSLVTLLEQGAPRDVDVDALTIFLRTGWFLGDETPFRAIRAVPPSVRFEWSAGVLTVERAPRAVHETTVSRSQAIDHYIELFEAAVARRHVPADEPFMMPLSGGADSRHILLELVRQGRGPSAVVTGAQRRHCPDVAVAGMLAGRLGIPHDVVDAPMDAGWSSELRKNVETSFCADEHVWYLPVADHLVAHTRYSYDGIGGDILSAAVDLRPHVVAGMRAGRVDEVLDDVLYETHREDVLQAALTPAFYRRIPLERARERLAESLRPFLDAPNPWSCFHFHNWDRREITLNAHATLAPLHVHTPFLDHALVDFLMSLPAEMLLGGRFHAETIHAAYPDFAGLPFARYLPRSNVVSAIDRARRVPPHLALHARAHSPFPRSAFLRNTPPIVRRPTARGSLGTFNRRAVWLRQLELLSSGAIDPSVDRT